MFHGKKRGTTMNEEKLELTLKNTFEDCIIISEENESNESNESNDENAEYNY